MKKDFCVAKYRTAFEHGSSSPYYFPQWWMPPDLHLLTTDQYTHRYTKKLIQ